VPSRSVLNRRRHQMTLAYLVNQYPKVSHTFVRREIAALERHGFRVERFSIRRAKETLADDADRLEAQRTHVVLDAGVTGLALAVVVTGLTRPISLLKAAAVAFRSSRCSDRGLLVHFAYLAEACTLLRRLRRFGCKHVHAHFGTIGTTVAMLCHELGGPPFSFTVHGPEEFDKPHLIALTEKISKAAFVVAVSSFGQSQLYRWSPFGDWSKIHVVRCGVDEALFAAPRAPIPPAPRLVCVGRLCAQKGQILLVEAAARLAAKGVDFEIVLVGDGEMRTEIEHAIVHHGLADRIRITGWASGETVKAEILASRALVLPSFAEGLPVVIMEALALGRPVISTYVAGIPELVEPFRSGWLVPAGSVDALAEAMREVLLAPPESLAQLGREGEKRVRELHDVDANARALASLLNAPQP
jgi:colanic acid/amylovoran biosynthesis glycosyltransferase